MTRPLGLKQLPTSAPVVVSTTAGLPVMPAKVVPLGNVTSMRLSALPDSVPLAESVKPTV